jgi:hypothetical protein
MKMRPILLLASSMVALVALVVLPAGLAPLGRQVLDEVLFQFPDSALVTVNQLEFADLERGWISRHAVYQTNADLATAMDWYTASMPGVTPRLTGDCVTLRQRTAFLHNQRVVAVLLCMVPSGTRILVSEDVYLSL